MSKMKDIISHSEMKELLQRDAGACVHATVVIWLTILGSIWLSAIYPNPIVQAAVFFIIVTRQQALHGLVHEASHYLIARDKKVNDFLGDLLFAGPMFIMTEEYRERHLAHHKHLGKLPGDTELNARHVITGWQFWRLFFRGLGGGLFVSSFRNYFKATPLKRTFLMRKIFFIATGNGFLYVFFTLTGTPWGYLYLWVLPLFTVTLLILAFRVIAEHQPLPYARKAKEDFERNIEPAFTRTIPAGPIERFVFSPLNFCFHHEHHIAPAIPFMRLPDFHHLLKERGYYEAHPNSLGTSYVAVLWGLIRAAKPQE